MGARGVWLNPSTGPTPLAAWLTEPDRPSGLGVVILPPVGYAASSSHRLWRRLAEDLAGRGTTVLRVDVAGCGDSAGLLPEVSDLGEWRAALPAAARLLRERAATRLVVIGCQLGAALALLDAAEVGADALVTIAPVLSGRTFVRSLRVTGLTPPDEIGGIAFGGHHFSASLLAQIAELRVAAPDGLPVLAVPDSPSLGAVLERPAEEAEVDPALVAEISDWVAALAPDAPGAPGRAGGPPSDAAVGAVREQFVRVGPDELVGVLTTPAADARPGLLVLLNSGSDPHPGPGRAWVELARDLAGRGRRTLRLDLRGWGESPDGPSTPGRPYDAHAVGDVVRAVQALDAEGPVVLGGLCAGAWIVLAAARTVPVAGVVALNPQLYWQPGDPVEALMSTTRARRGEEIAGIKREAAAGRWDDEDARGLRPPAGAWLDELVRLRRPCSLIFAEGDDGVEYLRDRLGRRLRELLPAEVVTITEVPGIDHGMHRTWLRPRLFDVIARELDRLTGWGGTPVRT